MRSRSLTSPPPRNLDCLSLPSPRLFAQTRGSCDCECSLTHGRGAYRPVAVDIGFGLARTWSRRSINAHFPQYFSNTVPWHLVEGWVLDHRDRDSRVAEAMTHHQPNVYAAAETSTLTLGNLPSEASASESEKRYATCT
jgi:hypothetical protein